jgi:hypothetical protein
MEKNGSLSLSFSLPLPAVRLAAFSFGHRRARYHHQPLPPPALGLPLRPSAFSPTKPSAPFSPSSCRPKVSGRMLFSPSLEDRSSALNRGSSAASYADAVRVKGKLLVEEAPDPGHCSPCCDIAGPSTRPPAWSPV